MSMYYPSIRPDELYHFGVLGMKWGVRRYQNKDGTLTSAGKRRYGGRIGDAIRSVADNRKRKRIRKEKEKKAAKDLKEKERSIQSQRKYMYKHMSTVSDEDLKKMTDRLRIENNYKNAYQNNISVGKSFYDDFSDVAKKRVIKETVDIGAKYYRKRVKSSIPFST